MWGDIAGSNPCECLSLWLVGDEGHRTEVYGAKLLWSPRETQPEKGLGSPTPTAQLRGPAGTSPMASLPSPPPARSLHPQAPLSTNNGSAY